MFSLLIDGPTGVKGAINREIETTAHVATVCSGWHRCKKLNHEVIGQLRNIETEERSRVLNPTEVKGVGLW